MCSVVPNSSPSFGRSPPGSSVLGISQAKILEWVAFPSPGDLPDPGIKPVFPALADGFFTTEPPGTPPGWNMEQLNQKREWRQGPVLYKWNQELTLGGKCFLLLSFGYNTQILNFPGLLIIYSFSFWQDSFSYSPSVQRTSCHMVLLPSFVQMFLSIWIYVFTLSYKRGVPTAAPSVLS